MFWVKTIVLNFYAATYCNAAMYWRGGYVLYAAISPLAKIVMEDGGIVNDWILFIELF